MKEELSQHDSPPLTLGVFDSGVGGLTVARALLRGLPGARLLYLADTAHVPYGGRPLEQVRDFALQIMEFLFDQGAEAIVPGCNMSIASSAVEEARRRFGKPVFEIIRPGARAARAASRSGAVGVIATQGTVQSGIYGRRLREAGAARVVEQACPQFVPLVERGLDGGPEVAAAVEEYLAPLRDAGVDTVVFGCTHYPFLRAAIQAFMGENIALIDPGEHVVEELAARYRDRLTTNRHPAHRFFCSGDPDSLRREGSRFLGLPINDVEHVDVPIEEAELV
jgi:glutamate racemase